MRTRALKEIRDQWPLWLGGLTLMLGSLALPGGVPAVVATLIYCSVCALIGISGFGLDMRYGTQLPLLVQPVSRGQIWAEKLLVQTGAMALVFLVYVGVLSMAARRPGTAEFVKGFYLVAILAPVLSLGCGPIVTLLIRHLHGAFWILMGIGYVFLWITSAWVEGDRLTPGESLVILAASVTLSAAGLLWSRKRFIGYQDYMPFWENVSIGWGFNPAAEPALSAARHPGASGLQALIKKELTLQQPNLIIFTCALLIGLGLGFFCGSEAVVLMVDFVCLASPWFVGAVAIAEERRLEINAWQLVLPPSRLRQWVIKVTVAVIVAVGSGEALFLLPRALVTAWQDHGVLISVTGSYYAIYALGAVLGGLLASSTARSYIESAAILTFYFVVLFILDRLVVPWTVGSIGLVPPQNLFRAIGIPLLAGFGLVQGYRNFTSLQATGRLLRNSLPGVLGWACVTVLATGLVYHRAWELLPRAEAQRAPVAHPERFKAFVQDFHGGVAVGPNGGLWAVEWMSPSGKRFSWDMPTFTRISGDNDWKQVASGLTGFAALKTDGTLWGKAKPTQARFLNEYRKRNQGIDVFPETLSPITTGHRWIKVARNTASFLGLKADGTLWIWGGNAFGSLGLADRSLVWKPPRQVGTDTNWVDILSGGYQPINVARKTDGTIWVWGSWQPSNSADPKKREFHATPQLVKDLKPYRIVESRMMQSTLLSKLEDGRILVGPDQSPFFNAIREFCERPANPTKLAFLRSDVDWESLEGPVGGDYALADDGRLLKGTWKEVLPFLSWDYRWQADLEVLDSSRDWIAVCRLDWLVNLGLKRDGSLWLWADRNHISSDDVVFQGHPLPQSKDVYLPFRFRPQRIGYLDF